MTAIIRKACEASLPATRHNGRIAPCVPPKPKRRHDVAARIYPQLEGARGMDDAERWQHALFFAMSPQETCHFSLRTARSALSLRRSGKKRYSHRRDGGH